VTKLGRASHAAAVVNGTGAAGGGSAGAGADDGLGGAGSAEMAGLKRKYREHLEEQSMQLQTLAATPTRSVPLRTSRLRRWSPRRLSWVGRRSDAVG